MADQKKTSMHNLQWKKYIIIYNRMTSTTHVNVKDICRRSSCDRDEAVADSPVLQCYFASKTQSNLCKSYAFL